MTTFIRVLTDSDKGAALKEATDAYRVGASDDRVWEVSADSFKKIPGAPFAYWVSERVRNVFDEFGPFDAEDKGRGTRCGLGTLDDFRFLRLFWELNERCSGWRNYFHGGRYSPYYDSFPLMVGWRDDGAQVKAFVEAKVGSASRKVQGEDKYFRTGFVFPRRTRAFSPKFMPAGGIFSTAGQMGFMEKDQLPSGVGLLTSSVCNLLISVSQGGGAAPQFEVGLVKRLPWPEIGQKADNLARLARGAWSLTRSLDTVSETSHAFLLPTALRGCFDSFDSTELVAELARIQSEVDQIALELYGISATDLSAICTSAEDLGSAEEDVDAEDGSEVLEGGLQSTDAFLSWALGVAFGRFDWRLATGEREPPPEPEPFDPLPAKSPGMLPDGSAPFHEHPGILVDDPGHPHDLARLIEEVLERVQVSVPDDVRGWLQREFFPFHLRQYSKSRRKAPIYWPLATESGSYTLWIYYPTLSDQTLYRAVNDFIEPKLRQVREHAAVLRSKGGSRSRAEERELEETESFESELTQLRETLLKIAAKYHPNQDDGVQITAAPLWPLFRHKPWQKVLKETWAKLEKGEYDWAHLAMSCWPERVREKCKTDKSLAIAHGCEALYVEPAADRSAKGGRRKRSKDTE